MKLKGKSNFDTLKANFGDRITTDISTTAKEFITQHINSVWQLELLLLLKSCNNSMNIAEVSRMMHMEHSAIDLSLQAFALSGILSIDDDQRYRYSPNYALSNSIDETARMFSERRIAVINFIYAVPAAISND
ncbi:MAG: hypothetical protein JST89_03930 [Cyanobacteria bacterium SZAS-4]|nr:hypothetical protein [Cyanobacteria bacterium SZAS-4]